MGIAPIISLQQQMGIPWEKIPCVWICVCRGKDAHGPSLAMGPAAITYIAASPHGAL